MEINFSIVPEDLKSKLQKFWDVSGEKIKAIERDYPKDQGSPVFTVAGKYTTRGWTEWTEGFQYGSAILQYDAVGEDTFLDTGRQHTIEKMASHVSHFGVHDHGFNNVSTYGNLLRLMHEEKIVMDAWEKNFYELALKISGAVQAQRWTEIKDGGFIHSFNGAHSLFVDTVRTLRILSLAHALGHQLLGENDRKVNLLQRSIIHAKTTAKYSVYYGEGRDFYDEWGRTAHESLFNVKDGNYRCPNTQQGYSGFSTWTRGLSWAVAGFPEQLEFLETVSDKELQMEGGRPGIEAIYLKAARATCDFYIAHSSKDGITYWDTGAPGLAHMGDIYERNADPYNDYEPVDSTASAISAQGLLRLGHYLKQKGENKEGEKYWQAGLTVLNTLLDEPYLSVDPNHQGLLLHSIYHRPNNWDHIPEGSKIPHSESSMWGDYHMRELALYVHKILEEDKYYTFFGALGER